MRKRNTVITLAVLLALCGTAAGVPFFRCGRTQVSSGIPDRHYNYKAQSQPVSTVTGMALKLSSKPAKTLVNGVLKDDPNGLVLNLYQMEVAKLQVDQCAISQFALQLRSDGKWTLSLRADQNPLPDPKSVTVDEIRTALPPPNDINALMKRNRFILHLRCLSASKTPASPGALTAGKAVVANLVCYAPNCSGQLVEQGPISFWVQRGQPYHLFTQGRDESGNLAENFDIIDRVEVELTYE